MPKQNEANGTASEPIARYDELPILRTYKVCFENMVQIGGFWVVGHDKAIYHIEMPDKVKECMWKNAKRYDIQSGKVMGYTNYDRIVSKSPGELAEWLAEVLFHCSNTICDQRCPMYECCCDQSSDNIEDWLKQEVSE